MQIGVSDSARSLNMDDSNICRSCSLYANEVACGLCGFSYHRKCLLITPQLEKMLEKCKVRWHCPHCQLRFENATEQTENASEDIINKIDDKIQKSASAMKAEILAAVTAIQGTASETQPTKHEDTTKRRSYACILKDNDASNEKISEVLNEVPVTQFIKTNSVKIIKFPTPDHLESAKSKLTRAFPSAKISNEASVLPKITVVGVPENMTSEELTDSIKAKNPSISKFVSAGELKFMFFNNAKSNVRCAIFSLSPNCRQELYALGDKIYVGMARLPLYSRFWVSCCSKCLRFGHSHNKCRSPPASPICGFCSKDHLSHDCPNKSVPRCFRCANANLPSNHTCFSLSCPSFLKAKSLLKARTLQTKNY